jgi:hypothetical protein
VGNDTANALGLATAVVVLLTAALTLALTWRNRKKVQEIHVMVNQQSLDLNSRIDQLTAALVRAGVVVPAREDMEER